MRLAEDIVVQIGAASPVRLRPTLRAAFRLERAYGGFDKLLAKIGDGNLAVIVEVITNSDDRADVLSAIKNVPLAEVIPGLINGVANHVLSLAGVDPEGKQQKNTGEPITFAEFHTKLYRIATGWLGWSPEQAWQETPAEILEAYNGHLEMLRAIHGGAEPEAPRTAPDNAKLDRVGLHGLRSIGRQR